MDDLRLPAVAARLVAWHNRHPLARRIAAAQVHAVGYVALPFVGGVASAPAAPAVPTLAMADAVNEALAEAAAQAPATAAEQATAAETGSLRERALARARQAPGRAAPAAATGRPGSLLPDFNEDFIDPLSPRQVARFAARLGRLLVQAPADGPVREVRPAGKFSGRQPATVYLLTAAVETGTRRSRVLLGPGPQPEVLGRRIWSVPRVTLAGALLLALGAALFIKLRPPGAAAAPPAASAAAVMAAASAAAAPSPASASASAPALLAHAAAPVLEPAPEHAPALTPAAAPPDAPVRLGRIELPLLRPQLSEAAKAAARQARPGGPPAAPATTAAAAAADASALAAPATAHTAPPPQRAVAAPPPGEPAFAVSTRTLRTRTEAEQVQVAMQALLRTVSATAVQVDVMPKGDDWRVVAYPFAQRALADKARGLLVSRGMRVEVVGF